MKHTYPEGCDSSEDRMKYRRMARKKARADGTYTPEPRYLGTQLYPDTVGWAKGFGKNVIPAGICPKCRLPLDATKRAERVYEDKVYHAACSPDFPWERYDNDVWRNGRPQNGEEADNGTTTTTTD